MRNRIPRLGVQGAALALTGILFAPSSLLAEDLVSASFTLKSPTLSGGGQAAGPSATVGVAGVTLGQPGVIGISTGPATGTTLAAGFWHAVAGDSDGDGVPDTSDNCVNFPNPGQSDVGGVGLGSAPDGIGDACQCGDVNGNGFVTTSDALIVRRALLVPPSAVMSRPDLCDVGGNLSCSTADPLIVRRALLVPPTASIAQQCAPANP